MKTAVVILNWNGAEMMRRFLPSVVRNTPDAEVIVADNGSTDRSLLILREEFPTVKTIILDRNYGFAEGYNKAIAQIDSEYIVLLNSDVEVEKGWLTPLITFMDKHKDAGACQPKLLSWHDKTRFEYAGASGGFIDRFGYPYCRGRVFATVEKDKGQYDDIYEIHWATGACIMVRRNVYMDYGGLDGRFFAHNEEIDFCWRIRHFGWKIYAVPQSHVWHVGGGTLPQGNPRKTYLNFRNNLLMLYKNLPKRRLNSVMRWRLLLDYIALVQFMLKGQTGDAKAILKARRDFNDMKRDYKADRDKIQKEATHQPDITPFSILWRYYAKGEKTFAALRASEK